MTVSSTATRIAYTGNGVTTAFAFSWRFLATSEIKVYVNDVLQSTGYSVSAPGSSGTVTFSSAPANGAATHGPTISADSAPIATTPAGEPPFW